MLHQEKDILKLIITILETLYELNTLGYYTAWLDWSGHTNGFYIKIIRGKWQKGEKEKIIYEALVCTKFKIWEDGFSGKTFVISDFFSFIQSLIMYKPSAKVKTQNIPA